jgi:hypothetical protein
MAKENVNQSLKELTSAIEKLLAREVAPKMV